VAGGLQNEQGGEDFIVKYRLTVRSKIKGHHFKRSEPKRPGLKETFHFSFFSFVIHKVQPIMCVFSMTKFQPNKIVLGDIFSPSEVLVQARESKLHTYLRHFRSIFQPNHFLLLTT
jgi:hypothetical protein